MPKKSRLLTPSGWIEVAPVRDLRRHIRRGLRRHGMMTSATLADLLYWGRTPRSRLGQRWRANATQRSATRRALAWARREGDVVIVGRSNRWNLYAITGDDHV